jgi:hypothetical protein
VADPSHRLTAGTIWQDMLAALRPAFWTLFALAAPFTLLVDMVMALYGPAPPKTVAEVTPQLLLILGVIPALIGAIAQMAVAHMVVRPGDAPRTALSMALVAMPTYVGAILITALPTGLGFLLLIVPGLYLTARMFLVIPVAAVERLGAIDTIRRSWALTADCAWTIALLLVLGILFILGASLLAAGLGAAVASVLTLVGLKAVGGFVAALLPAILGTMVSMASAAAAAVVYLRVVR